MVSEASPVVINPILLARDKAVEQKEQVCLSSTAHRLVFSG